MLTKKIDAEQKSEKLTDELNVYQGIYLFAFAMFGNL